jgi:hypothetical protein
MMRIPVMLLAIVAALTGIAGCATRTPGSSAGSGHETSAALSVASPAPSAATAAPSVSSFATIVGMPVGGPNPEATIPNPGTGTGNPLLVRALLPQPATLGRLAAILLPPGVIALPDRNPQSLYIGLRQVGTPVVGPSACDGWTAGLSTEVLSRFNQSGVQLGVEENVLAPADAPLFAETIITGPPPVLDALGDPPLPASCRDITTPHYSGGVKPVAATVPGAVSARAFAVTGPGKDPVWQWAEVIQGQNFVVEISIPVQAAQSDPPTSLTEISATAYRRAATILAP